MLTAARAGLERHFIQFPQSKIECRLRASVVALENWFQRGTNTLVHVGGTRELTFAGSFLCVFLLLPAGSSSELEEKLA